MQNWRGKLEIPIPKRHLDWKGNLTLVTDYIILNTENAKEFIKKPIRTNKRVQQGCRRAIYKKLILFLYSKEQSENKSKRTISFRIRIETNRIGITLTK